MPVGANRYGWNASAVRYYDRGTGRFVSRDQIRGALDDVIAVEEGNARRISERLRAGDVNLAEWQAEMRRIVKDEMLQARALASGGWDQLTASDYGQVGAAVREQYQYLDRFTNEIRNGLPLDGRFLVRAGMYAKAARPYFHDVQAGLLDGAGYSDERNILHAAEHCAECVDMTALGWVPLGTVTPIGSRLCLGNDRCTMRYR